MRVEGAAKSLIRMTLLNCRRATNQGVVGSNPASRANRSLEIHGLDASTSRPFFFDRIRA
jgi:hypothetical protein